MDRQKDREVNAMNEQKKACTARRAGFL